VSFLFLLYFLSALFDTLFIDLLISNFISHFIYLSVFICTLQVRLPVKKYLLLNTETKIKKTLLTYIEEIPLECFVSLQNVYVYLYIDIHTYINKFIQVMSII